MTQTISDLEALYPFVIILTVIGGSLWVFRRDIAARIRGLTYLEYLIVRRDELRRKIAADKLKTTPVWLIWTCVASGAFGVFWYSLVSRNWIAVALFAMSVAVNLFVLRAESAKRRRSKFHVVSLTDDLT